MLSKFFIDRPRFACVISIITVLAGFIAIKYLPIAEYPHITPSQIKITTNYPGADAETVQKAVIAPIEEQLNGVKGMLYMSSTASDAGTASITVTFGIGTDGDANTVNVQNRVNWATPSLPQAVRDQGIVVKEQNSNILMFITLTSPKGTQSALQLNNYARNYIKEEFSRIPGVGDVNNFGELKYAMRIWLDPQRMAGLNINVEDVINAIRAQNVQVAAGSIGEEPINSDQIFRFTVQTKGRLNEAEDFKNIVIRSTGKGKNIKVKDVARVELASERYSTRAKANGNNAAMMAVYQLAEANGLEIAAEIKSTIKKLEKSFPEDMKCSIVYDTTEYISSSIYEVVKTLIEAIVLVILITFLFLGDWRSTLIPTIAIPVSLIGTFAFLFILGFSINVITLFGLILAIGIVVDDAILVIENVNRLMHDEHLPPKEAAIKTMMQVSGAVVATTLVLLAMFAPICFLGGITGEIYRQFGITISIAVVISSVNALTLSPALSALVLKNVEPDHKKFILFRWFDRMFESFTGKYMWIVKGLIRKFIFVIILIGIISAVGLKIYNALPKGFLPNEDKGAFFIHVQLPNAAALPRTQKVMDKITMHFKGMKGVETVAAVTGFNMLAGTAASNCGLVVVKLDSWDKRQSPAMSQKAFIGRAYGFLSQIQEAMAMPFAVPPLPGMGGTSGFSFVLEDLTGTHPKRLSEMAFRLMTAASKNPKLFRVFTTFTANEPKVFVKVDRRKALDMGVSIANINNALKAYIGQAYINDFNKYGKVYRVWIQGEMSARSEKEDITSIYVRSSKGKMVPLSSLVDIEMTLGPQYLKRHNMRSSLVLLGQGAPGVSSGEAMAEMEKIANKILPIGMAFDWTDMSYQEKAASGRVTIILVLSLLFIYLFLVAQYESWMIPGAVMLAIPIAFLGAVISLLALGMPSDIYSQVGMVLLFGVSAKTSILIVEFAKSEHEGGKTVIEAAGSAAKLRFRAVLMTAISFICGTIPLVVASGAGAASRKALGVTVVGGMTLSCILGTLLVPGLYVIIQKIIDKTKRKFEK